MCQDFHFYSYSNSIILKIFNQQLFIFKYIVPDLIYSKESKEGQINISLTLYKGFNSDLSLPVQWTTYFLIPQVLNISVITEAQVLNNNM